MKWQLDWVFFQDVSHNKLSDLPTKISALTRLMRLNVSHNTLQILPHGIGGLSSKCLVQQLAVCRFCQVYCLLFLLWGFFQHCY